MAWRNWLRTIVARDTTRTPPRENPERWDCDCGGIWRILTLEQINQKFRHLKLRAEARERGERVPGDDWRATSRHREEKD